MKKSFLLFGIVLVLASFTLFSADSGDECWRNERPVKRTKPNLFPLWKRTRRKYKKRAYWRKIRERGQREQAYRKKREEAENIARAQRAQNRRAQVLLPVIQHFQADVPTEYSAHCAA